jgi:putative transposase
MLIENALADVVRFFQIDALSSSVGFKVDFDMALLVVASIGRYIAFRPHAALDGRTPDQAYFDPLPLRPAA